MHINIVLLNPNKLNNYFFGSVHENFHNDFLTSQYLILFRSFQQENFLYSNDYLQLIQLIFKDHK